MTQLFAPGCSITKTKRRRFLWAAWWSAPPQHAPFRKPDACGGGASTHAEALAEAERQANMRLGQLDPLWARAWNRVLRGEPPWPGEASREPRRRPQDAGGEAARSVWEILGVTRDASLDELRAAYRRKVLETHPDQGGDAEELKRVLRAYEEAERRLRRPRPRTG